MPQGPPHPELVERIHSPEFIAECEDYVAYAVALIRRARHVEGWSNLQAEAVVGDAVEACLSGCRTWPPGVDIRPREGEPRAHCRGPARGGRGEAAPPGKKVDP
jgi:hypothetical protein